MGPKAGNNMTTSLMSRSGARLYCMVDREAIGKFSLFKLE